MAVDGDIPTHIILRGKMARIFDGIMGSVALFTSVSF